MIELIATAESVNQAEALLQAGVDILYIGNDEFSLRFPGSLTREEMKEITDFAHLKGKQVYASVNALVSNDRIKQVREHLAFLEHIGVDAITVRDPIVIHLLNHKDIRIPYWYDGHIMITNARQVNFWAGRGAKGAVFSREMPFRELQTLQKESKVPLEVQVYGAACIHYSKQPLLLNYFNEVGREIYRMRKLHAAELKNGAGHYAVYEDSHGAHIFAAEDINLLPYLKQLTDTGLVRWKLDGVCTSEEDFLAIATIFAQAKQALNEGNWTETLRNQLNDQLHAIHPKERSMNSLFFPKKLNKVM